VRDTAEAMLDGRHHQVLHVAPEMPPSAQTLAVHRFPIWTYGIMSALANRLLLRRHPRSRRVSSIVEGLREKQSTPTSKLDGMNRLQIRKVWN
jgi:hypothetical protein